MIHLALLTRIARLVIVSQQTAVLPSPHAFVTAGAGGDAALYSCVLPPTGDHYARSFVTTWGLGHSTASHGLSLEVPVPIADDMSEDGAPSSPTDQESQSDVVQRPDSDSPGELVLSSAGAWNPIGRQWNLAWYRQFTTLLLWRQLSYHVQQDAKD